MDIPTPVQEALRDSITSGTFVDTKCWVFSKRSSKSGRVGEPKPLFVNGHVLRSVPRLGALLDQGESKVNLRTQFPAHRKPYTSDYDYDADSDLEEDEDWDYSNDEDTVQPVPNSISKNVQSDSNMPVGNRESNSKDDESSDIISISDVDSLFSGATNAEARVANTATLTHVGTVLFIEDAAFVTFQALLRYLYTNEIQFAPWGSPERRKSRAREEATELHEPLKPSPKSIYRLADKYNIPELKELALRQIQLEISKCDIVEEVFSKFTSRYPELRELELGHLARTLLSTDSSSALNAFKEKIKAYSCGQLLHAKDVLPALYDLMGKDKPFKDTPTQPPAPSKQRATNGNWGGLKDALSLSLTSGSFLDSQFYALDSKPLTSGAPTIRPVYFCSMVGGVFLSRVTEYFSRIWPSGKESLQCVDEYDSEVDDKGSGMGIPIDAHPLSTCIPEDPLQMYKAQAPALVLKSGTARTWSAIFFYVYTLSIEFAPLSSRCINKAVAGENETPDGATSILHPQDQNICATHASSSKKVITGACSPKSIYALASKINIACLRDLAVYNIESQLDEKNIVQEFLSPFTASHEPIRQMQYKLLFFSALRSSAEGPSFLETIRDSSSGEYPYRAAAMEQIFERRIHECRERVLAQTEKTSHQKDPVARPKNRNRSTVILAAAQLAAEELLPLETNSEPALPRWLQTQQGLHKTQPSQTSGSTLKPIFSPALAQPQPISNDLGKPTPQPTEKPPPPLTAFPLGQPTSHNRPNNHHITPLYPDGLSHKPIS